MPLAQDSEFILKTHSRMMRLLIFDIAANLFNIRFTDRKDSVSTLPVKLSEFLPFGFDPRYIHTQGVALGWPSSPRWG